MRNFDRLRWIVEEHANAARTNGQKFQAEAYCKVLDEMNDLDNKYPNDKDNAHDLSSRAGG